MDYSLLRITDGTDEVSFLRGPFYLSSAQIGIPEYKGGGVFIDSPLSAGRRIAHSVYTNATDRYDLKLKSPDGDVSDDYLTSLVALLDKAALHWKSNGITDPVWLEMKSSRHSNIQYAHIVVGSLQGLGNKFAQPYLQDCSVLENELIVLLERRNWRTSPPGTVETLTARDNSYSVNIVADMGIEKYSTIFNHASATVWTEINTPDTVAPSSLYVYSGKQSLRIVDTGSNGGVYQDIGNLKSGDTYTVTARAYIISGTARLQIYDGGGTTNGVNDTSTTTGQWVELSVTKTVPGSGSIRVTLEAVGASADIYFDHVESFRSFGPTAATTTDPVLVQNARGDGHIDYIMYYDQNLASYSSNLIESTPPYNIFPSTPAVGDILYLGSTPDNGSHAPFGNVVFNLSATATDITVVWEVYDGSTWTALPSIKDHTDDFSVSGENLVGWLFPAMTGEPYSGSETNNIEAHWVRARISAVGTAGTITQTSYHPYTVVSPYVEIPGTSLVGDLDPKLRMRISRKAHLYTSDYETELLAAGGDDGDTTDATTPSLVTSSATVNMGQNWMIVVRFPAVDIPYGTTLSRATLYARSAGGNGAVTSVYNIYVEDNGAPAALVGTEDPYDRTWSSEIVQWVIDPAEWDAVNTKRAAPDVTSLVQGVVSRTDWQPGNAIVFFIKDWVVASAEYRTFSMYENDTSSWQLELEWKRSNSYTSQVIVGSRSTDRGSDFQSHINLSQEQSNEIVVEAGGSAQFTNQSGDDSTIGGINYTSTKITTTTTPNLSFAWGWGDRARVTIPYPMSTSYSGTFRVYVRMASFSAAVGSLSYRLRASVAGDTSYSQAASSVSGIYGPQIISLGSINISEVAQSGGTVELGVQTYGVYTSQSAQPHYLLDLILIPSDEWTAEFAAPTGVEYTLGEGSYLEIDSIDSTSGLSAELVLSNSVRIPWAVSGSTFQLESGRQTRLYFLFASDYVGDPFAGSQIGLGRIAYNNSIHDIQMYLVREFMIGRGTS